jgi:hypothetical protein
MDSKKVGFRTNRRDFLSLVGVALGGVVLTRGSAYGFDGGRWGGSGGGSSLPNGYHFYRILTVNGTGSPLGRIARLDGGVMMNDHSEILFHARNTDGRYGIYELTMDYSGRAPVVAGMRTVVEEGDTLPDGRKVGKIARGDTNANGNFAAVIETTKDTPGVYVEKNKGGLQPLARFLDPIPAGGGSFGGSFGDLDLHDNDDLLLVGRFSGNDRQNYQGLFHLPGSQSSDTGELLIRTGQLVPQTGAVLTAIGLIGLHNGGNYVAQMYGMIPNRVSRPRRSGPTTDAVGVQQTVSQPTALFHGVLGSDVSQGTLLSASRRLPGTPAQVRGETIYGPRVRGNSVAHTTHLSNTSQRLTFNGHVIAQTGGFSPLKQQIAGVSTSVMGPNGLLYYLLITQQGLELCVSNGRSSRTMLARGDVIGGMRVDPIMHAFHSDQADSAGRIAFTVEFNTGPPAPWASGLNTGHRAIVVGIPV